MKPPRCRACGVEEWRHVCGGATATAPRPAKEVVKETAPRAKPAAVSQIAPLAITNAVVSTYRYRDPWARRLYQRDLMRSRRRAARRVSGGVS